MASAFELKPGEGAAFETKRFHVRTLRPDDVDDVYLSWWNDTEIQADFNQPALGWNMRRAVQHVKTFDNRASFHFGIFSRSTGQKTGYCTIRAFPEKVALTIVCIPERSQAGADAVSEVMAQALDFIFEGLAMEKAEIRMSGRDHLPGLDPKAFGYRPEAVLRQHEKGLKGDYVDVHVFGLLKAEWEAGKREQRGKA